MKKCCDCCICVCVCKDNDKQKAVKWKHSFMWAIRNVATEWGIDKDGNFSSPTKYMEYLSGKNIPYAVARTEGRILVFDTRDGSLTRFMKVEE